MSTLSRRIWGNGRVRSVRSTSFGIAIRIFLIFCCVFAGAVFVSTVPTVAAPTIEDVTIEDNESWIGTEDTHEIRLGATDIDTTDGPGTITVELSGWSDDSISDVSGVEVLTDGVEIDGGVEVDGTTITFDVADTSETAIELDAVLEVTIEHPLDSSFDGAAYGASVDVTGSDGSASEYAEVTIKRLSYSVDGTERFPPSTEFIYQNQEVTVSNLDSGVNYNLYTFDPDENAIGDPITSISSGAGTTATINTSDESIETGWYIVYDGNTVSPAVENAFQIQPHQLDAVRTDATVDTAGVGAKTSVTLDSPLRSTPFDVYVTSHELDSDALFDLFKGAEKSDVERTTDSSTIVLRDVEAGDELPMTFESLLEATYTFEFEAVDTEASDTTTVRVEERETNAQFGSDLFETSAGELVEIDLSLDGTDEAYVMIGGDGGSGDRGLTNYFDILHVEGESTVRINTRLLGTNVPSEEVYIPENGRVTSYVHDPDHEGFDSVSFEGDADDIFEFRSEIGIGGLPRPIQPERLRLVAGDSGQVIVRDDGVPDFERPLARSNLRLTGTDGFGDVNTYIAPRGSANEFDGADSLGELTDQLTERQTVAKGDRLIFEVEARGITGLVSWLDGRLGSAGLDINRETLSTLLAFPDGVVFEAERTNSGRNEPISALDIDGATDGDLSVLHEPMAETGSQLAIERYYFVIDTRETGPFDREISPGDEFRFRFGYNSTGETDWFDIVDHDAVDPNGAPPHFPYYDADAGNITESRAITVEERSVTYDQLDSRERPVLKNATDAELSGTTNLAPGTDLTIQLLPDNTNRSAQITLDDITLDRDGTFRVNRDLSALESGESMTIEFYVDQQLVDRRSALIADADEPLTSYEIVDHPESVAVTRGESISDLSVTIENTGYLAERLPVRLTVDGEPLDRQIVDLDENSAEAIEFDDTIELDPGEYTYAIAIDNNTVTGQLAVEPTFSETEHVDDSSIPHQATDSSTDNTSAADESPESPDDGGIAPIGGLLGGIGARHAIGGAVVVGGAHVLGFWS